MGKRKITLILEKDGIREEYEFSLGLTGAPGAFRKIKRYIGDGWRLVDASGDPRVSEWIKGEIARYNDNPDKYKVPIKSTVKLGTSIVKPEGKISVKKVLKAVAKHQIKSKAQRIRDKFRRKKKKLEGVES